MQGTNLPVPLKPFSTAPTPTLKTASGYQVSNPTLDELLIQLNNVEVLRINLGRNMTIKTPGDLTLEANNLTLKSNNNLRLQSYNGLDLKASGSGRLEASGDLSVRGATVSVTGSANVNGKAL